jgi:hypothetical protein
VSGGRRRLLYEVSAPVRASLDQLRALVDGDWLVTRLGWTAERFAGGGVERSPGVLAGQGGWWYRGEYTAEEVGGGVRSCTGSSTSPRRGGGRRRWPTGCSSATAPACSARWTSSPATPMRRSGSGAQPMARIRSTFSRVNASAGSASGPTWLTSRGPPSTGSARNTAS